MWQSGNVRGVCEERKKENAAARWLTKEELGNVEWLPADVGLIERLKKL